MKRLFLFLILAIASISAISAQAPSKAEPGSSQWVAEVRDFKHNFLVKELDLSAEQRAKFFPIYDAMEDEVAKINSDTRKQERRLQDAADGQITDLEYDQATDALFELKAKEADIELRYLPRLREVLTKKQLFKLKGAERKFSMTLMRRHHDLRKSDASKEKSQPKSPRRPKE